MSLVCVAIISKNNFPLYLRVAHECSDVEMQFHHIIHTAIDVIEEKISFVGTSRGTTDFREHYLGPLYPSEKYKIYGYATNTKVKLIIVTENITSQNRDTDIKPLFRRIHSAYVDMFCNPFYTPDTEITSKRFEKKVMDLFKESKSQSSRGEQ